MNPRDLAPELLIVSAEIGLKVGETTVVNNALKYYHSTDPPGRNYLGQELDYCYKREKRRRIMKFVSNYIIS